MCRSALVVITGSSWCRSASWTSQQTSACGMWTHMQSGARSVWYIQAWLHSKNRALRVSIRTFNAYAWTCICGHGTSPECESVATVSGCCPLQAKQGFAHAI